MVKIEHLIFGYRLITIPVDSAAFVGTLLLRYRIQSDFYRNGKFIIREKDFEKFKRVCDKKIEYQASETLGILGAYKRIKHKSALFISAIIMTLFILLLSDVVWDIRISGNKTLSDAEILCELSDNGFEIGSLWHFCDRSKIENNMLISVDKIGWININRRGSVAYVEVIESDGVIGFENVETKRFSNIVANTDCVIEEVTVERGVAVVKPGDVVKKGDLLISGIVTAEEGVGRAVGIVKGRIKDTLSVETERNYEKIEKSKDKLTSVSINLFNFSINILKIYGNLTRECDIIEDVEEYSLFGTAKLPFAIKKEYVKEYSFIEGAYNDSELVEITSQKLTSALHTRLVSADLYKVKTYGEFTDTGYKMYSDIVFCADVGCEVEINVE